MDIQAISSVSTLFQTAASDALTQSEKSTLQEIISRYDPENLSQEDREAMRAELEEEGLWGNVNTFEALENAGFVPPPPPPSDMQGMDTGSTNEKPTQELLDLVSQLEDGEIDQETFTTELKLLLQDSELVSGNFFDQYQ